MCGFAGYLGGQWRDGDAGARSLLRAMNATIARRGPDSDGYWTDEAAGIALGHRRLAILDLSAAGAQPMLSRCGRYVLAFNGEIYNHQDIRLELQQAGEDPSYRGTSDTETLLAGFSFWGIRPTVERCVGMFAFALWDRQTRTLTLGRDRLGEKPLYYGWQGSGAGRTFLFGSELKALRAHPAFTSVIDRGALSLLMRHNCVPAPHSIYRDIHKLAAGQLIEVSASLGVGKPQPYWSVADAARRGSEHRNPTPESLQIQELETLLKRSVRQQMIADVPIGAFLSGGVDSSLVVALMQSQSERPIRTFTIGYGEGDYNEAVHAAAVARHLGTSHTELYVTPEHALGVIDRLPGVYCEPFSDSSQIPTILISELARQHVAVALTGDAADELFGGYNRHLMIHGAWQKLARVPAVARNAAARLIKAAPNDALGRMLGSLQSVLPASRRQAYLGDKIQKAVDVLGCLSVEELYLKLVTHWDSDTGLVIGGTEPPTLLTQPAVLPAGLDDVERAMLLDQLTYLPDDNLTKVDRAAMSVSLETRVPMLDHRVVEYSWRMPASMKLRGRGGKWPLRQILYRYVPAELIERPKMGFSVPIAAWLRGPLREWADALLDPSRLRNEGYFDPAPVRQRWQEHLEGRRQWQYPLWDVLMFQAWLEKQ